MASNLTADIILQYLLVRREQKRAAKAKIKPRPRSKKRH